MNNPYLLKLHSKIDLNEIRKTLKQKSQFKPINKSCFEEAIFILQVTKNA